MPRTHCLLLTSLCCLFALHPALAQEGEPYALLQLDVPPDMALAPSVQVNLSGIARALGVEPGDEWRPFCALEGDTPLPVMCQFDPAWDYDAATNATGTLSIALPADRSGKVTVRLYLRKPAGLPSPTAEDSAAKAETQNGTIVVSNSFYEVLHDPAKQAGLPSSFTFSATGKRFDAFSWNDRVHDKELGSFYLARGLEPELQLVNAGPIRTLVRVKSAYTRDDARPDSLPEAVYDFAYYAHSPIIGATATCRQETGFEWREHHFIEINFPGEDFTQLATSGSPEPADLVAEKKSSIGTWVALLDGPSTLGLVAEGARIYDGRGGYGTYIHGPWVGWPGKTAEFSGVLYVSGEQGSLSALRDLSGRASRAL